MKDRMFLAEVIQEAVEGLLLGSVISVSPHSVVEVGRELGAVDSFHGLEPQLGLSPVRFYGLSVHSGLRIHKVLTEG